MTDNNLPNNVTDYEGASRCTGIKKSTLAWMVHRRKIPHIRLGPRMVRFRISELETWMEERSVAVADKREAYTADCQ